MSVATAPEGEDDIVVDVVRGESWDSPGFGDVVTVPIGASVDPCQSDWVTVHESKTVVLLGLHVHGESEITQCKRKDQLHIE